MKRVPCTACASIPPYQKAMGREKKCHECNDVGYIEYNDTNCTHLPPAIIEYEIMCGGWQCECGASGPWSKAYDKAYGEAEDALKKIKKVKKVRKK